MHLVAWLICLPLVFAGVVYICRQPALRAVLTSIFSVVICVLAVCLAIQSFHKDIQYFQAHISLIDKALPWLEVILAGYLVFIGIKHKRLIISILAITQTAVLLWLEHSGLMVEASHNIFVDKLSILMALVIGIVGSLICFYSIGYMKEFHEEYHKKLKDNRNSFTALLFIFLSAMFGVVFFNNLLWIFCAWEITTLCSFLLISYKQNEESVNNALRALAYNLIGGLAFALGIAIALRINGVIELDKLMQADKSLALLAVIFLSFAGLTKSAQLPFSSWLLGAMVAPTPVSALLHSSTMVKAGVYLILRFAAVLQGTVAGLMLALIGGLTFLVASFIAVSESDAKKVLAYSTIANLGLIVLCAGIGTYEALWAAALLIIFHAIAKCLLFLCLGVVEHKLHSRNIEDMSGLIITMPKISIMMQIGMAGMFLAPFGMLISKWAVLKALVDSNPILVMFVVFGGSATLLYWVKWIGKLIMVTTQQERVEVGISKSQWFSLAALSGLTIATCALFPVVSSMLIQPYVIEIYNKTFTMSHGNITIMLIMLAMMVLFPLSFFNYGKKVKVVDAYLGGANTGDGTQFTGAMQKATNMEMSNYYLEGYFSAARIFKPAAIISIILLGAMFFFAAKLCG